MTPRFSAIINATGPNARMPFIHDTAVVLMKQANVDPAEIMDMSLRVDNAKTYDAALAVVREWFNVDRGDAR
jgi:hypothetical protein